MKASTQRRPERQSALSRLAEFREIGAIFAIFIDILERNAFNHSLNDPTRLIGRLDFLETFVAPGGVFGVFVFPIHKTLGPLFGRRLRFERFGSGLLGEFFRLFELKSVIGVAGLALVSHDFKEPREFGDLEQIFNVSVGTYDNKQTLFRLRVFMDGDDGAQPA